MGVGKSHGWGTRVDIYTSAGNNWAIGNFPASSWIRDLWVPGSLQNSANEWNHWRYIGPLTRSGSSTTTPTPSMGTNMSTVYYRTSDYLYALAGDSPGTAANWIEATDPSIYNKWVQGRGNANVPLDPTTFAAWKALYLQPLNTNP
jgi:hypothetical protein